MKENKEDSKKWLELFKIIVNKESHTALSVNDLVNNINNSLDLLISKCK